MAMPTSFSSNLSSSSSSSSRTTTTSIPQLEPLEPELDCYLQDLLSAAFSYDTPDPAVWDPNRFLYHESCSIITPASYNIHYFPITHADPSSTFHCLPGYQHGQVCAGGNCTTDGILFQPEPLLFNHYDQVPVAAVCGVQGSLGNVVGTGREQGRVQSNSKGGGGGGGGGSLSAQSLVARERRKRIAEKTQQLAKLIPGAHRMNTADMFRAGYKYVKFLQAQIAVLQQADSARQEEEMMVSGAEELQFLLLSCPSVQEKLYMEEKCLVTKELVVLRSSGSGEIILKRDAGDRP